VGDIILLGIYIWILLGWSGMLTIIIFNQFFDERRISFKEAFFYAASGLFVWVIIFFNLLSAIFEGEWWDKILDSAIWKRKE
jgi:hypothetical protein